MRVARSRLSGPTDQWSGLSTTFCIRHSSKMCQLNSMLTTSSPCCRATSSCWGIRPRLASYTLAGLVHFLEAQKDATMPDQLDQAVADSWWLDHQSADACPWTLTLLPHALRVSFATGD